MADDEATIESTNKIRYREGGLASPDAIPKPR